MKKILSEKELHKQICNYIKLQYPNVLFNTDMSGLKLTLGQAVQAKKLRSCNGFPDIVIYEHRLHDTYYGALFLEVKKESPYKKDSNELKKSEHVEIQDKLHIDLRLKGYYVEFVWTFEMAKNIIDKYLK